MNLVVADDSIQGDAVLALALFDLLKDTRELEYMAHQFHWNITGDKFKSMHDFYEEEYDQLFKDQDEIAEQIRQQGYFVPVIDNIALEGAEYLTANEFEAQLIHYSKRLGKNIELINKVNKLAGDNIAVQDLCARLQGLRSLTMNLKVKSMLNANKGVLNPSANVTASTIVTAGYDKGKFKEIMKESDFFKILREDCGIRAKHFYAINRGLRLAIRVIKEAFEQASIRFFVRKNEGGYIRVELGDKVYIISYTIYDSGKIKVWTRVLKTNMPVNMFDFNMLNLQAKPFGTKLPKGLVPTWMSI